MLDISQTATLSDERGGLGFSKQRSEFGGQKDQSRVASFCNDVLLAVFRVDARQSEPVVLTFEPLNSPSTPWDLAREGHRKQCHCLRDRSLRRRVAWAIWQYVDRYARVQSVYL